MHLEDAALCVNQRERTLNLIGGTQDCRHDSFIFEGSFHETVRRRAVGFTIVLGGRVVTMQDDHLVPWVFDYYTKLDFSPVHKIHKIHALRMVSASYALSSVFCYRGLVESEYRSMFLKLTPLRPGFRDAVAESSAVLPRARFRDLPPAPRSNH